MPLKLPRLPSGFRILNPDGTPTNTFQIWFQQYSSAIESSVNGIAAALAAAGIALDAAAVALDAAAAANTAADNAQAGVEQQAADASLSASGVINETAFFEAAISGNITVPGHDRLYGNPTLNPTVAVTGDTLSTAYVAGDIVYVYYVDPTRAGGAVTYLTSTDPEDANQVGDVHSIGSVGIPSVGTQTGSLVRPRGIPTP